MERKYVLLGGVALLAVIVVAGLVFTPSGFLVNPDHPMTFSCVNMDAASTYCDGSVGSDYWKGKTWRSHEVCDSEHDDVGKPCIVYHCGCKRTPE
jgi:hypothetical protein|tara:strand:+ start:1108 stop:1392 length:285 start_codon:yes stop_codon:yes gene_type:complete